MTKKRIFTRPVIREFLNAMSIEDVNFDINSDGEYVITVGNDVIQSDQAKATYMALTGLETGYQIGLAKASGSDPAIHNRPLRLKDTKLAQAYKKARQEVKDLTEENEHLLSKEREEEVVKHHFQQKLEKNPERCKYYFMYLYINGYICDNDRLGWADGLMAKIGRRVPTHLLPLKGVASTLVSEYWQEIWEYV